MKFTKTNKKFIDVDDEEIRLLMILDEFAFSHRGFEYSKWIDSVYSQYLREGRISPEQFNKLVEIYEEYIEYDEMPDDDETLEDDDDSTGFN